MPGVMELVNRAKEEVENLSPSAVARELGRGDVVIVDIREPHETRQGMIPGAIRAPRGMLEFNADPTTQYHIAALQPDRRVILYCSAGSRSALGAKALKELGYRDVAHLEGGFRAWQAEGREVEVPRDLAA
ncbi:MAG TPA: rhodanese-like domain-containing protein [Trueperaceae bacterium]